MFEKAIPQYHLSYTEEENRSMHEYLFSASESELVTALLELAEYYSDNEENKVKQALDDFALEIKLRYEMLWSSFFVTLRPNFHYRSYTLP